MRCAYGTTSHFGPHKKISDRAHHHRMKLEATWSFCDPPALGPYNNYHLHAHSWQRCLKASKNCELNWIRGDGFFAELILGQDFTSSEGSGNCQWKKWPFNKIIFLQAISGWTTARCSKEDHRRVKIRWKRHNHQVPNTLDSKFPFHINSWKTT